MSACFVLYVTCFSHNMLRQFYNELLNVDCLPFLKKEKHGNDGLFFKTLVSNGIYSTVSWSVTF